MAERVMTLYLEDTNIRLLIARGKQAERWANMPLEPGLVSAGVIVNETQVAQKIRELLTTFTISKPEPQAVKISKNLSPGCLEARGKKSLSV